MHGRLIAEHAGVIHFTNVLPEHLQHALITGSSFQAASGAFGHILLQQLASPLFTIACNYYYFIEADVLHLQADAPMLELLFNLGPPINCHLEGLGNLSFQQNSFNLVYLPVANSRLFINKQQPCNTFSIQFTPDYLAGLPGDYPLLKKWMKKVAAQQPALLFNSCLCMQKEVSSIIGEIQASQYTGEALHDFLHVRISDILFLCFHNNLYGQPLRLMHLWDHDLEGIEHIRQVLFENMSKDYSMSQLALLAGMNKNKLARGFRQVVGISLFNYQNNIRMIRAKSMLLSTAASITVIGYELGYRDVQAFSKAFKKHYGLSPTVYRRKYGVSYN